MKDLRLSVLFLTLAFGAVGVGTRALVAHISALLSPEAPFIATVALNLLGSFLMGLLYTVKQLGDADLWSFWTTTLGVGFLGGLTTFSTFTLDFYRLFVAGTLSMAWIYLSVSIVGGMLALYGGMVLAENFF